MIVLSMLKRSYVDDVTDHKGRLNGSKDASFPDMLILNCSVAQNRCSTKKTGRAGKKEQLRPKP